MTYNEKIVGEAIEGFDKLYRNTTAWTSHLIVAMYLRRLYRNNDTLFKEANAIIKDLTKGTESLLLDALTVDER